MKPPKNKSDKRELSFRSTLEKSTNRLWGCHFVVPDRITKGLRDASSRRVVCILNDKIEYQTAVLPYGNGAFVIRVNKPMQKKFGLVIGSDVSVRLRKDESKYGLPMPEEFDELLHQDEDGKRLFHQLTDGKKRTLLYFTGSQKKPDARLRRAAVVVNHLKANHGVINFKQLYAALKVQR